MEKVYCSDGFSLLRDFQSGKCVVKFEDFNIKYMSAENTQPTCVKLMDEIRWMMLGQEGRLPACSMLCPDPDKEFIRHQKGAFTRAVKESCPMLPVGYLTGKLVYVVRDQQVKKMTNMQQDLKDLLQNNYDMSETLEYLCKEVEKLKLGQSGMHQKCDQVVEMMKKVRDA